MLTNEQKYDRVSELRTWLCGGSGRYRYQAPEERGPARWVHGWGDGHRNGCLMTAWYKFAGLTVADAQARSAHSFGHTNEMEQEACEALGFSSVTAVITFNDGQGDVDAIARHLDWRLAKIAEAVAYEMDEAETQRMLIEAEKAARFEDRFFHGRRIRNRRRKSVEAPVALEDTTDKTPERVA
jgi:hypothetical protein